MYKAALAIFIAGLLILTGTVFYIYQPQKFTAFTTQATEHKLIRLVNEQRIQNGLQPLKTDERLMATARLKTLDMVEHDYFEHERDGVFLYEAILKIKPECKTAGENLARSNQTLQDVVKRWMNSPTHRENILKSYEYTGISIEKDTTARGELDIITQHFCSTQ